jgi:hypothetical protein
MGWDKMGWDGNEDEDEDGKLSLKGYTYLALCFRLRSVR